MNCISKNHLVIYLTAVGFVALSTLVRGAPPPRPPGMPPAQGRPIRPSAPPVNPMPQTPPAQTQGTTTNNNTNNNPNANNPNAAQQGNGPNTNPNAPNNTPNGPNQNPFAPFNGPVGQAAATDFGAQNALTSTIPLGNLGTSTNLVNLGSGTSFSGLTGIGGMTGFGTGFPWFLAGGGYWPYGVSGYYADTYWNPGYFGIGSGHYGTDYLDGGSGLYLPDTPQTTPARAVAAAATGKTPEEQRQVIENAKSANLLYYQFREVNRAYRLSQIARDRPSPQVLAKVTLESAPRWLGRDELDQATGTIAWPGAFETPQYAKLRENIENAFRVRSSSSNSGPKEKQVRRP